MKVETERNGVKSNKESRKQYAMTKRESINFYWLVVQCNFQQWTARTMLCPSQHTFLSTPNQPTTITLTYQQANKTKQLSSNPTNLSQIRGNHS